MAEAPELSRINTLAQLDELLSASRHLPVWVFKHSLICPTSSSAWAEFETFVAEAPSPPAVGVVEIQNARDISREVEARTGVRHESPQVLLIRDGKPLWHASHWQITTESLSEAASAHGSSEEELPS